MKFTLVFMTGRQDPRLDWVIDDLIKQRKDGDEIELLVIDFYGRNIAELDVGHDPTDRLLRLQAANITSASSSKPMPNIWQGDHRITKDHWWATATARNTALVLASNDYVAFLDDRCHLGPEWLETVRQYEARRDAVLVGGYEKKEDGSITSRDHRIQLRPNGQKRCSGGWLYGCSFAAPLEWLLEINGFESGSDSLTGEDYLCGLMLQNVDRRLDYEPKMFVSQDRTRGNTSCKGVFRCTDKGPLGTDDDKSHHALRRFGKATRTEFTPDLRKLRAERQQALKDGRAWSFPIPDPAAEYRDWYDGELIASMV